MQRVQRAEDRGNLSADVAFGLRALAIEPRAEVAVLGVFHREAVAHLPVLPLGQAIEDAQRPLFAAEKVGEVRFPQPTGQAVADLDAHLRGETRSAGRRGEIYL